MPRDYKTWRDLAQKANDPTLILYTDQYGRSCTKELLQGLAQAEGYDTPDEKCTQFRRQPAERKGE